MVSQDPDQEPLIFGVGDSDFATDDTILYATGIEVMRISPGGVISFPEGKPADELAQQVMEILEKITLRSLWPLERLEGNVK